MMLSRKNSSCHGRCRSGLLVGTRFGPFPRKEYSDGLFSQNNPPRHRKPSSKTSRRRRSLQKPNGVISPRVQKVGGERFAIVCVDPAKHRSEWMMADYFGNLLIEPQTVEHQAAFFKLAVEQIRQAQQEHDIQDTIVVVERTGNYYLPPKRAFAAAGFETRVVHPFATKQYRMPADPGNKTDETDLYAQHRAAVAGFGLCEFELEPPYRDLQLRARHRRNLVEKSAALACQIRDHLHLAMPGYANLFDRLFETPSALAIAHRCESPATLIELGHAGLRQHLREKKILHRAADHRQSTDLGEHRRSMTTFKTGRCIMPSGPTCTSFISIFSGKSRAWSNNWPATSCTLRTFACWRFLASTLFRPPSWLRKWDRLPSTPTPTPSPVAADCILHVIRAIKRTMPVDRLIRQANRRLRCVLMRIADNLACHCNYYRGQAEVDQSRGIDKRASRVKIAKRFSRLALACVAGDEPMRHPCFQGARFDSGETAPLSSRTRDAHGSSSGRPGDSG